MAVQVEVFCAPACPRCAQTRDLVRVVAGAYAGEAVSWRAVDVIAELDYAVALGVRCTPSVAIDGELRFSGPPSETALRAALQQRLARHD